MSLSDLHQSLSRSEAYRAAYALLDTERMIAPQTGNGHWWRCKVRDVSACGRYVKVTGPRAFGKARWVAMAESKTVQEHEAELGRRRDVAPKNPNRSPKGR